MTRNIAIVECAVGATNYPLGDSRYFGLSICYTKSGAGAGSTTRPSRYTSVLSLTRETPHAMSGGAYRLDDQDEIPESPYRGNQNSAQVTRVDRMGSLPYAHERLLAGSPRMTRRSSDCDRTHATATFRV